MSILKKFRKTKRDIQQWWFLLHRAPAAKLTIGQVDDEKSQLMQEQKFLILAGKKEWPIGQFSDLSDVNKIVERVRPNL